MYDIGPLLETLNPTLCPYIIPTIPAKGTPDFGGDHPFYFLAEPLMPSRVASAACNRVKLLRVGVRVSGCKGLGFRVQTMNPKPLTWGACWLTLISCCSAKEGTGGGSVYVALGCCIPARRSV